MNRFTTLILFACIFFTNIVIAQSKVLTEAPAAAGGFSAARLGRLDSAMNAWVTQKWVNGSAVLIARHGKIVFYKAHGYNDPDTKAPLERTDIFRIASQTKALTVVSVMMLWEEGKFSLDDPVSKFIPSFANEKVLATFDPKDTTYTSVPAKRQVTIRDLLTHTSGIGYPNIIGISTPAENALYGKSSVTGGVATKGQKLEDAMNRLGGLPLFFSTGRAMEIWLEHGRIGLFGTNMVGHVAGRFFRNTNL